jgi:hypothetical protein
MLCNVFKADEHGLFYNLLPNKTYTSKGVKLRKDKTIVIVTTNMDRSKKPTLLIAEKSHKPH